MVVHLAVDGFSRFVLYSHCCGNNKSQTVLNLFTSTIVDLKICPRKIRTDCGGENALLWEIMPQDCITGSSVHNQRVERLNRDVNNNIRNRFAPVFYDMEEQGLLNVENELDIAILQCIFLLRVNQALKVFKDTHNNHPVRTEQNLTPVQLIGQNVDLYFQSNAPLDDVTANTVQALITGLPVENDMLFSVQQVLGASGIDLADGDDAEAKTVYTRAKEYISAQLNSH